jgi:hypothetical protein
MATAKGIIMWENPHQETGVACSRNSPPSPPGRPSLLHRAFSEPTGVATSCINSSLFLPRPQLPPSYLPVPAPALLAILSLAPVGIHTSAALGHRSWSPWSQFPALVLCRLSVLRRTRNLYSNTPVQLWVSSFLLIWKSDPSAG